METVNYFKVQYLEEGPIPPETAQNDNRKKLTLDEAYRIARSWKYQPREEVEAMTFEQRRERTAILKQIRKVERDSGVTF